MNDAALDTPELRAKVRAPRQGGLWLTFDAPWVPLEALMAHPEAVGLWAPGGGANRVNGESAEPVGFVALGVAERFTAWGEQRFVQLREQAVRALAKLDTASALGAPALCPRVFGGFAFQVGRAAAAPWSDFGEAQFVLPRIVYAHLGQGASLSVLLPTDQAASDAALGEALALRGQLGALAIQHVERLTRAIPELQRGDASADAETDSRRDWTRRVQLALSRIASGEVSKLVLARRFSVRVGAPISVPGTLKALSETHTESTRFALRMGAATFVGASPERLMKKHGENFSTEALAGTFRRGQSDFAAELLRSPKEHEEHRPVLSAILERLAPFAERVEYPASPELRELPQLMHLRTPIEGRLRTAVHVLDLVRALHPTPAVGGVPTNEALEWIARQEAHERGWYAGPVGWFDAAGDGEFVVALRSGVIEGSTLTAYAGAGIVHGSDPASEYAETELKFTAILHALRAEGAD
jgi:isochorismate synthase